jgi:hypothetical protein
VATSTSLAGKRDAADCVGNISELCDTDGTIDATAAAAGTTVFACTAANVTLGSPNDCGFAATALGVASYTGRIASGPFATGDSEIGASVDEGSPVVARGSAVTVGIAAGVVVAGNMDAAGAIATG